MSDAPELLLEQALELSPSERALLASGLLASLDDSVADGSLVEQLWSEETERRASQITSTDVKLASWDQVVERVDGLRA
jgi:hypothetical protein